MLLWVTVFLLIRHIFRPMVSLLGCLLGNGGWAQYSKRTWDQELLDQVTSYTYLKLVFRSASWRFLWGFPSIYRISEAALKDSGHFSLNAPQFLQSTSSSEWWLTHSEQGSSLGLFHSPTLFIHISYSFSHHPLGVQDTNMNCFLLWKKMLERTEKGGTHDSWEGCVCEVCACVLGVGTGRQRLSSQIKHFL